METAMRRRFSAPDWQDLAITSHLQTARAVAESLDQGDVEEARQGLEELIEAMARSEKRALRSQLVRLLVHVLKWKHQPDKRSRSWAGSIYQARDEIEAIQEEVPSLSRRVIESMWENCMRAARKQAQAETGKSIPAKKVSWEEAFEADYFFKGE